MITHKQFPDHHIFETDIGGRTFTVETGKVAELCNAECICRYGDTVVLVTAVASSAPKSGIEYFPLTIEFEERLYSVGRIPGAYLRREGRPSEKGILVSRLIDRPHGARSSTTTCAMMWSSPAPHWPTTTKIRWKWSHLWALSSPPPTPTSPGTAPWPLRRSPIWTASISSTRPMSSARPHRCS